MGRAQGRLDKILGARFKRSLLGAGVEKRRKIAVAVAERVGAEAEQVKAWLFGQKRVMREHERGNPCVAPFDGGNKWSMEC